MSRMMQRVINATTVVILLGLSLSFDLVRQHGGTLAARNHPDGGACFEFWLPALRNDPPPPEGDS